MSSTLRPPTATAGTVAARAALLAHALAFALSPRPAGAQAAPPPLAMLPCASPLPPAQRWTRNATGGGAAFLVNGDGLCVTLAVADDGTCGADVVGAPCDFTRPTTCCGVACRDEQSFDLLDGELRTPAAAGLVATDPAGGAGLFVGSPNGQPAQHFGLSDEGRIFGGHFGYDGCLSPAGAARPPAADAAPYQLLTDWRLPPVVGVAPAPTLAWALPRGAGAQAAARVQLFDVAAGAGAAPLWDAALPGAAQAAAYAGPRLAPGRPYAWRVQTTAVRGAAGPSAWSANASIVAALVSGEPWPAGAAPVWAGNASAAFVLLRGTADVGGGGAAVVSATAFATANPQASHNGEAENAKLLGAYKLHVDGRLVGLGPGRPGTCGPVCPVGGGRGPCTCAPHHVFDSYDVTAAAAAAAAAGAPLHLAVAAYNAPGAAPSQVLVAVVVVLAGGDVVTSGSGAGWRALAADAWINASCCTAQQWFVAPRENWVGAREPVGWRDPGFDDGAWTPAAARPPFAVPLVPRPTRPLAVAPRAPALVAPLGPGHVFVDLGAEVQGGVAVAFAGAADGDVVLARFGETLLAGGGPPRVRYEMSTGNSYWMAWTLRAGASVVETHEYLEFRYLELVAPPPPAQCARSAAGDYATPVALGCASPGATIAAVAFASWGTPTGDCAAGGGNPAGNDFAPGACAAPAAAVAAVVAAACVGRRACALQPSDAAFDGGADPCRGSTKWLAVAVTCSGGGDGGASGGAGGAIAAPPTWNVTDVTAWVVAYPAAYVGDAQVAVPDAALAAVWALCRYTVVATALDMFTDSNTRQRSVICSEALLISLYTQYATSLEYALPAYTLEYTLNSRPLDLGWAEWQALSIMAVHVAWLHSGDLSPFVRRYAQLRNFTEAALVAPDTGLWTCVGSTFDCSNPEIDWPTGSRDGFVFRPANTVVNGYTALAMSLFAEMAAAAGGHDADAALFNASAAAVARAVDAAAWDDAAGVYVDGVGTNHSAWHTTLYLLAFGVVPPARRERAWAAVTRRSVGDPTRCNPGNVYPAHWAFEALYGNTTDYGHAGLAYLTCNGTNSWLAMLRQGATTTMEAWSEVEKPNLTWSHPWAASPAAAVLRWLFGVRPLAPGFARVLVQPQPGSLPWGNASVPTLRGPVAVAFEQDIAVGAAFPTRVALALDVPGGVIARVCVPAAPCAGGVVSVDGARVTAQADGAYACVELAAGAHAVSCGGASG